ncbi:hypothetical protein BG000_003700 [Podila horticola]|nr:hypothetical protein BG000_003700 [Podila horticola]
MDGRDDVKQYIEQDLDHAPWEDQTSSSFFHIAHHLGYFVRDSGAFFQEYGTYVLTILELVRYGDMSTDRKFPPFNSNVMLENSPFAGNLYRFLKLVDNTIMYLQSTTIRKPRVWISAAETRPVFSMIHSVSMDGAARFKDLVDQAVLSNLSALVKTSQEYCCRYIGALKLRLDCCAQVKGFYKTLVGTHAIEVTPSLGWILHESDLRDVLSGIDDTGVVFLELEGLSHATILTNNNAHSSTPFLPAMQSSNLQLITQLNFPAPSLCVSYLGEPNNPEFSGCQLEYTINQDGLVPSWVELSKELTMFSDQIFQCNAVCVTFPKLSASPNESPAQSPEYGLSISISTTSLFNRSNNLAGMLSVQAAAAFGLAEPAKAGTLSQITVETDHDEFSDLRSVLDMLPHLSTVKLETHESNLFRFTVACLHLSRDQGQQLQVILVEITPRFSRTKFATTVGRLLAEIDIHSRRKAQEDASYPVSHNYRSVQACGCSGHDPPSPAIVRTWIADRLSGVLRGCEVLFLDAATEQHPKVLSSLSLDTYLLSQHGLSVLERVLARSQLCFLKIACNSFNSSEKSWIVKMITATQWTIVRSLVLYGNHLDDRTTVLGHCGAIDKLRLWHLAIRDTRRVQQQLTHVLAALLDILIGSESVGGT